MLAGSFRKLHTFVVLAALVLLSACATKPLLPLDESLELKASIAPDSGVGFIKVQVGQGSFLPADSRFVSLQLKDAAGKTVWAQNVQPAHADYTLFVFTLPAGDWRLEQLQSYYYMLNATYTYTLPIDKLGQFNLRAGEITDLGTIAVLPAGESFESGRRSARTTTQAMVPIVLPHAPEESARLMSIVRSRMPATLKPRADKAWTLSPVREELIAPAMRQGNSRRFTSAVTTGDGTAFGEEFGQIRIRRGYKSEWQDSGLTGHITALTRLSDGTLLAGSNHGIVQARQLQGGSWQDMSLPLRDAVVHTLGHHPKLGIVAAARSGGQYVVFKASAVGAPWVELKRMPAAGSMSTRIDAAVTARGFSAYVQELGFTAKTRLYDLDASTGIWIDGDVPTGALVGTSLSIVPDGTLFTLGGNGFSPVTRASVDGGKTWETRTAPSLPLGLHMFDANLGYLCKPDGLVVRASSASYSVWKTTDGARNWNEIGKAPAPLMRIFPLGDNNMLGGLTANGTLYVSADAGVTWAIDEAR